MEPADVNLGKALMNEKARQHRSPYARFKDVYSAGTTMQDIAMVDSNSVNDSLFVEVKAQEQPETPLFQANNAFDFKF